MIIIHKVTPYLYSAKNETIFICALRRRMIQKLYFGFTQIMIRSKYNFPEYHLPELVVTENAKAEVLVSVVPLDLPVFLEATISTTPSSMSGKKNEPRSTSSSWSLSSRYVHVRWWCWGKRITKKWWHFTFYKTRASKTSVFCRWESQFSDRGNKRRK